MKLPPKLTFPKSKYSYSGKLKGKLKGEYFIVETHVLFTYIKLGSVWG
jgi:hypothetical protein